MVLILQDHEYWNEVDVEPRPDCERYAKYQIKAKVLIMSYMTNNVVEQVNFVTSHVRDIFKELDRLFSRKGLDEQLRLRQKINALHFKIGEDIDQHISRFLDLCRQFNGAASNEQEMMTQSECIIALLLSMPEGELRSVLENDDRRDMQMLSSRLKSQYRFLMMEPNFAEGVVHEKENENKKLRSKNRKIYPMRRRKNKHSADHLRSLLKPTKEQPKKCFYCGKHGHLKRNCYKMVNPKGESKDGVEDSFKKEQPDVENSSDLSLRSSV